MERSLVQPVLLTTLLLLLVISPFASGAAASSGSWQSLAQKTPSASVNLPVIRPMAPVGGPVSEIYVAPSGVMPVVVLTGSPYQMGYQYAMQVPEEIAIVRDAAWASALSDTSYQGVLANCSVSREYIRRELPGFDFLAFFHGMSDGMNALGVPFTPDDPLVMEYYGGRKGPGPDEHCTAFVATGNLTGGGVVAGENFDYYPLPSNSYSVVLALYPDRGHAAVLPSGAGRTGSNAVANDQGLVYIMTTGPSKAPGDVGPGITGFLELPYVGMTAGSVGEAETFITTSTRAFPLQHMLVDRTGRAEVIEATRSRYAIRTPAETGDPDLIIATNHYLNTTMKPSQPVFAPLSFYPSSYYRYITAQKVLTEGAGDVNFGKATAVLSLTDWWDGSEWHRDDPFGANTINRFRPDVATLYSFIAVPGEGVVSVCTGNPGIPTWGSRAPGQTGTFVNYTVGRSPSALVWQLRKDADAAVWERVKRTGSHPGSEEVRSIDAIEDRYWEAVWWHDRGVLETDPTARAVAFGRAATGFSVVIARAGAPERTERSG